MTTNDGFLQLKEEIELRKQINIAELNKLDEATRLEVEGYRTGAYLRLEVHDVPFEMVEYFDPYHPVLVGGIGLGEENVGYMQVRNYTIANILFICLLMYFTVSVSFM